MLQHAERLKLRSVLQIHVDLRHSLTKTLLCLRVLNTAVSTAQAIHDRITSIRGFTKVICSTKFFHKLKIRKLKMKSH